MITSTEFTDLAKDLFEEYLPKVSKTDRNSFIQALMAELQDVGLNIEDDDDEDEDDSGVEELEFDR
jgi:hypothetical protein